MEEKRRGGHEDDYVQTILFTAGTILVMACIKHAVAVSLIQQWRAWVFLVLNIVLLAIVFTSFRSRKNDDQEMKVIDKKSGNVTLEEVQGEEEFCYSKLYYKKCQHVEEIDRIVEDESDEGPRLPSPEELQERAEAFIAMFRKQLVKDAQKGGGYMPHGAEKHILCNQNVCPRETLLKRWGSYKPIVQ